MKRNLITLILLTGGTFSFANYNIIIDVKSNNYEMVEELNKVEYTNWVVVNSSCSVDNVEEDFYYGIDFKQKETCQDTEERTKNTYKVYTDGRKELLSSEKESKTTTEITETDLVGTHLESTCKDILSVDSGKYNSGDGLYHLSQSGTPEVYCDMTRNGGGWMRVTNYDWNKDQNNKPSNLNKYSNKSIYYNSTYYPIADAWWVPTWGTQPANTIRWVEINAQPIHAWTESMIDFQGLGFRTLDEFYNAHNAGLSDRSSVNGQYVDGFSFTYGANNSRNHLFTVALGSHTPFDDEGRLSKDLSWIGSDYGSKHSGDYMSGSTTSYMYSNTIFGKIKPLGSENISLRLMADQGEGDETIGMRKYILWVR